MTKKFSGAGRVLSRASDGENQDGKEKEHTVTAAEEDFHENELNENDKAGGRLQR